MGIFGKIMAAKMKFDRMMDSCEDEEMRAVFRSYKKERDEDFSQNRQELAYASGDTGKRDGMIRMHPALFIPSTDEQTGIIDNVLWRQTS